MARALPALPGVASPSPLLAPVMTTTFPSMLLLIIFHACGASAHLAESLT